MIGITVSVGYADKLRQTLLTWQKGLDLVYVITDDNDNDTAEVAEVIEAVTHRTSVFYDNGATFNKGGAMDELIKFFPVMEYSGWVCVFDADILPPVNWHECMSTLEVGNLYGAPRYQDGVKYIPDPPYEMPGYFWIFHTDDPHLPHNPTFTSWKHAGNYDTVFKDNWPAEKRVKLPLRLNHIGQPGRNWWGIGNEGKMKDMYMERAIKRGYEHERV